MIPTWPVSSPQRNLRTRGSWAAVVLGSLVVAAGCGAPSASGHHKTAQTPSAQDVPQPGTHNLIQGGQPYAGPSHLKYYVKQAQAHPRSVSAVFHAAIAEFVNGHLHKAAAFYQKAAALDPKNGIIWNNLANIYLYGFHQPDKALPLYQKAVTLDPHYVIGWYNLVNCETALKNPAAARSEAQHALRTLPKTPNNPYYANLVREAQAPASTAVRSPG